MAKLEGITVEINGDATGLNSALKDTNKELSSTQSELNQVNKLLKLDPSNTTLLAQKQELLSKAVESTKDKLTTLKKAQEDANKSGLTNTDAGQKAYRELEREIAAAEASMKKLENETKETNTQMSKSKGGISGLVASIGEYAGKVDYAKIASEGLKVGIEAIATASAAAITAVSGMAVSAGKYADDINTMASKTGLATDQLQIYQRAADLVDVDVNTIAGSMKKLTANMSSASSGTGSAAEAFKSLGISVTDGTGALRDNDEVFQEAIKALGSIENETERDATAMKLFGKSATELNPLIEGGIDTISELGDEWKRLGIILDQDTLDGANAFNDQLDILKSNGLGVFNALGSEIAASLVPAMTEFNTVATDAMGGLLNAFKEDGIEGLISEAGNVLGMILEKITQHLPDVINMGITLLQSLIDGLQQNLPAITDAVVTIVVTLSNGLLQLLPQIIDAGIQILLALVIGIAQALPELIPAIVDCVMEIVTVLIDNLPLLIEAGMQILFGVTMGIIQAIPELLNKLPEVIDSLINYFIDNGPQIMESGWQLLVALIEGLINAIPELLKALPQIIEALFSGLKKGLDKMKEVGKFLIEGLWQGILNAKDWLLNKIKGFASTITDGIKSFFGIESPSKVFRDEVGKYLAQGIGVGFDREMDNVIEDMKNSADKITEAISTNLDINAMPKVRGQITSQNYYTTKTYQNTTEITKQPSNVILQLDKKTLGQVMVPVLNERNKVLGVSLS